jgi:hypothetical protein
MGEAGWTGPSPAAEVGGTVESGKAGSRAAVTIRTRSTASAMPMRLV